MKNFAKNVANEQPFFTGDGVKRTAQLTIEGQAPLSVDSLSVTAMHQTDWQGRVALSNQPRTNWLRNSQAQGAWTAQGVTVTAGGGVAPDGTNTLNKILQDTSNGVHRVYEASSETASTGDFTALFVIAAGTARYVDLSLSDSLSGSLDVLLDLTSGSVISTGISGKWTNFSYGVTKLANGAFMAVLTGTKGDATYSCLPMIYHNADGVTFNQSFAGDGTTYLYGWATMVLNGRAAGVYIPTTSAPVTVTDYAVDASGNVTFGQPPAVDATLDWDGSISGDIVDASATFLAQYATSPILTSLIQAANAAIDPNQDFDQFLSAVWDVYTAQGFGLDIWGRIVNVPRTINIPATIAVLGFKEASDAHYYPFNQEPFYNGPAGGTLYTLTDDAYRVLILTKALANISSFTAESMNALLNFMFNGQGTTRGSCYVLETATPMQIQYVFNFALQSWEAAVLQQASLMPRPAGVGVTITVNP